jgi:hypothetical protein
VAGFEVDTALIGITNLSVIHNLWRTALLFWITVSGAA